MKNAFSIRELVRWLPAVGAVVVSFYVALYFKLFVLIFSQFPKDLAEPTAGFTMGLLIVLTGSLFAPRQRLAVAFGLLVISTAFTTTLLNFHLLSSLIGGIVAVSFVAWWFNSRRTRRSTLWVAIGVCAAFFVFVGVVFVRYIDRPAHPEALTPDLVRILGTNASLVTAFYRYDRGGFIDHDWLWRIDGKPEAIALVVSGFGLLSTNEVPRDFWSMAPHYWPRSMPVGGEAFKSPFFSGDSRGQDGTHYFMVHDKLQSRAFVWVKDNF